MSKAISPQLNPDVPSPTPRLQILNTFGAFGKCVCVRVCFEPPFWSVWPDLPLIYQGGLQGDRGKVEDSLRFQAYLQPPATPPPPFLSPRGVLIGLIEGNDGRAKTKESYNCCCGFS